MTPKKLWAVVEGKKLERQRMDSDIWLAVGNYILPAIKIGVRSGAWGKGELEYPDKPIYRDINKKRTAKMKYKEREKNLF